MATKDKKEAAQEEKQAAAQEERVVVTLNPDTGLGGYGFDEKFDAVAGQRYSLAREDYERYSKIKHNGLQVIVKA